MARLPEFPQLVTEVPGPRSRQLAAALAAGEAPGLIAGPPLGPLIWTEAQGMSVRDADGNVLLDGTGGLGTALVGHGHERVLANIEAQARRCLHALADVHAAEPRVALVQRLAALAPRPLDTVYLAGSGSEAVEIALKTAFQVTGRTAVIAYEGAYHGLAGLAAACTDFPKLREPFAALHAARVTRLPFPDPRGDFDQDRADADVARVEAALAAPGPDGTRIGAVLVEPVQYRGGARAFPTRVLQGMARACRAHGALLILDEVATGCGRTGQPWACQGAGVVPDLLCVGKGLGGGMPIAACIGARATMERWRPEPPGEAMHTSTALGHPVACAAACAVLAIIEEQGLVARAAHLGARWLGGLSEALDGHAWIGPVRGYGMILGVPVVDGDRPAPARALAIAGAALRRGLIVLPEGPDGSVLVLSPPLTSTEAQAAAAIAILREAVAAAAGDAA